MKNPVYIRLCEGDYDHSIDVADKGEIIVDFDANGNILGVEILKDCHVETT